MDHTGAGVQIESRELSAIPFVEKIAFEELQFDQTILGRGAFGTVSRARWRGMQVAVKLISTETEKKAFITELKQLSRVSHPNIVTLYGACLKPTVCLVMEYAEGGSLYNVLHGPDQPGYTVAHALSWCLQCAEGVDYLHNMKPKPLIHRDLKPPNLLLVNGGTTLKICDFGTACDKHTHMTNNKGSAAWMAPEVFEGSDYSEKCDVFSWGIILWETLTRHKPFETVDGPAFAIMWAVHQGQRPQPISNCPKPIQSLMQKCWTKFPMERPSMAEVVRIMQKIMTFFKGADIPLVYPYVSGKFTSSQCDTPSQRGMSQASQSTWGRPSDSNRASTVLPSGEINKQQGYVQGANNQEEAVMWTGKSAPPSLANSRESLDRNNSRSNTPSSDVFGANKRYSADMSKLEQLEFMKNQSNGPSQPARGHRRTGSYGNTVPFTTPPAGPARGHRRTGSHDSSKIVTEPQDRRDGAGPVSMPPIHQSITAPANLGATPSLMPPLESLYGYKMTPADAEFQLTIMAGEQQAEPIQPCFHSAESIRIWEEHLEVAKQYQKIQTDIAVLTRRKLELQDSLKQEDQLIDTMKKKVQEYKSNLADNEQLMQFHNNLKEQLEAIKKNQPYNMNNLRT